MKHIHVFVSVYALVSSHAIPIEAPGPGGFSFLSLFLSIFWFTLHIGVSYRLQTIPGDDFFQWAWLPHSLLSGTCPRCRTSVAFFSFFYPNTAGIMS
jgi:hypothetical protein